MPRPGSCARRRLSASAARWPAHTNGLLEQGCKRRPIDVGRRPQLDVPRRSSRTSSRSLRRKTGFLSRLRTRPWRRRPRSSTGKAICSEAVPAAAPACRCRPTCCRASRPCHGAGRLPGSGAAKRPGCRPPWQLRSARPVFRDVAHAGRQLERPYACLASDTLVMAWHRCDRCQAWFSLRPINRGRARRQWASRRSPARGSRRRPRTPLRRARRPGSCCRSWRRPR